MLLFLWWLRLVWAERRPDSPSRGTGLQLLADFSISGLFPLHDTDMSGSSLPAMGACDAGEYNKHGNHLMQAMRFAVEEINNGTGSQPLLPGVKLGYQIYDICSVPASSLATLQVLSQEHQRVFTAGMEEDTNLNSDPDPGQKVVAVIGPDSSSKSFTPAALLGAYLVPQISYQASNEMLSNKFLYPSFLRTIPSDKNQVAAMIQLLVHFKWTWITLLGSDNDYGRQGMHSLSQQVAQHDICIAYQAVIPKLTADTAQTMRTMVTNILRTKVNTIVLFSSKSKLRGFLPFVIEQNVTGKVWIGTEDWSVATLVSGIPRVHTIGTVLGISIKHAAISGFEEFERKSVDISRPHSSTQKILFGTTQQSVDCLQSTGLYSFGRQNFSLDKYDITSSFNVYKAVYAVAHALHKALSCDTGECHKRSVHPWQLVPWLKQVRFNLRNTSVYFDKNGDPPTGYDIVTWIWRETDWSLRVVGSFTTDPTVLEINAARIEWSSGSVSLNVPLSICSPECPAGHRKLQTGQHRCCFDCLACPAATFLNKSGSTTCQPCHPEKWAPPLSEQCLNRTVLLLAWDAPLSIALLFLLSLSLLMASGSALIFLFNLNTPVAKSAGGRTCLLILAALTAAAGSSLCHFGTPSKVACILKQPLFVFSFSVCLACMTVRAFQVVCIFKLASKLPLAYDTWTKNHGPEFTILSVSAAILFISVLRMALNPSYPSQDLDFYADSIVLECSNTLSPGNGLELTYVSLLSILCFSFSYMGKDLPANYNEAKCVTFSLMVYMISWISFFTIYLISRGPVTMAAHVFAIQASILGILWGYFFPKVYVILLRPHMNTTAHFQNCIQMYTMNKE
ncbi:taste receptor type 1 member 1 [Lampris incognitus]|uniref:taste receptor type 1 member 1 n=1 Tax=Lampris incognitus TaxID=2546036 RepID=UPI0024B51799|nr:taste receptor type 1 member 1 [Lampris incognitus]